MTIFSVTGYIANICVPRTPYLQSHSIAAEFNKLHVCGAYVIEKFIRESNGVNVAEKARYYGIGGTR